MESTARFADGFNARIRNSIPRDSSRLTPVRNLRSRSPIPQEARLSAGPNSSSMHVFDERKVLPLAEDRVGDLLRGGQVLGLLPPGIQDLFHRGPDFAFDYLRIDLQESPNASDPIDGDDSRVRSSRKLQGHLVSGNVRDRRNDVVGRR